MTCWLVSEPQIDEDRGTLRTAITPAEVSGFFQNRSRVFLVVSCGRAFPEGASLRFKWHRETGIAKVEDCLKHSGGYTLWLEVRRSRNPWLSPRKRPRAQK